MTFQETGRGKVRRKKQTFDVTSYFQTADRRSAVEAAAPAKRTERKREKRGMSLMENVALLCSVPTKYLGKWAMLTQPSGVEPERNSGCSLVKTLKAASNP